MTDWELILSPIKKTMLRLVLLDESEIPEDELQGYITSMDFSNNSNSDIRRTASVSLYMPDAETGATSLNRLWLNKRIKMYLGLWDKENQEFREFLLGTFMMSVNAYQWDAQSQELRVSLVDLMAAATSDRGSQIGAPTLIPEGSNVKEAYESIIAQFVRFKRSNVCEYEEGDVPYDLETDEGSYPIDVLHGLLDLYAYYEMFYDINGVFNVRKVPVHATTDPLTITDEQMHEIVISESGEIDFATIKNATEVWGKSIVAARAASQCTTTDTRYDLWINSAFEVLEDGDTIAFTADADCSDGQTIKIQDTNEIKIYVEEYDDEAGEYVLREVQAGEIKADYQYVVKYTKTLLETEEEEEEETTETTTEEESEEEESEDEEIRYDEKYTLLGLSEIHAIVFEYNTQPSASVIEDLKREYDCKDIAFVINPDSSFAVDYGSEGGAVGNGVIKQVLSGGDYANIYTTQLALDRASFENWKTTRLQDVIQLQTLYVPWLDVNELVEYTSMITGEKHRYIVQSIKADLQSFTMDLTLQRHYPYYPWLE